jgi:hypothetical protein
VWHTVSLIDKRLNLEVAPVAAIRILGRGLKQPTKGKNYVEDPLPHRLEGEST